MPDICVTRFRRGQKPFAKAFKTLKEAKRYIYVIERAGFRYRMTLVDAT